MFIIGKSLKGDIKMKQLVYVSILACCIAMSERAMESALTEAEKAAMIAKERLSPGKKEQSLLTIVDNRIRYQLPLDVAIADSGTPLFEASADDARINITKKLLDHGAKPDATGGAWTITPLYNAVEFSAIGTVKLLAVLG